MTRQHRAERQRTMWRRRTGLLTVPVILALLALNLPATAADDPVADEPTSAATEEPKSSSETTEESAPPGEAEAPTDGPSEDTSAPKTAEDSEPTKSETGGLLAAALPAAVGDGTLSVTLAQVTGTPGFDADDAAGHDSSASNEIVRTNDTVTYTVGVRYEGEDQTNPTITFNLPKGEELVSLPPFCLAGSSVSPATLPEPVVPVTDTSWESLPSQTVTCVVDDQTAGTSLDYKFISQVRPEVPNGTLMDPVVASATSDQVTTPAESDEVSHTVSAAADFDVSKRLNSTSDNSGPLVSYYNTCSFDASRACRSMEFPLTMSGPDGGKGLTPLASPITVTDDLSPDAFYGAGTTTSAAWLAAGAGALDKYAPRISGCGGISNLWGSLPYSSGGDEDTVNAVRDSGTIACAQPTLGTPVDITFTSADTTAYTVPTKTGSGAALSSDLALVISIRLTIEIPLDAVSDLGTTVDGVTTLNWKNAYTEIDAVDITGNPNQGEDPANNVRTGSTIVSTNSGFNKTFSGATGATGNTPTGDYSGWQYEGPPGSGTQHDGSTVVLPGQTVLSNLYYSQTIPPQTGTDYSHSAVVCDVWDDTKLALPQTYDFDGANHTVVQIPSGGDPVWVSGFNADNVTWTNDLSGLANLKFEYSYTATPGSGEASSCDDGTWASSPGGVPGATLVDGVWEGVNRVRVSFSTKANDSSEAFLVNISVALTALASAGDVGTILPNWASIVETAGVKMLDEVFADPDAQTKFSSYTASNNTGALGDRLILGTAKARIKKYVENPSTGEFTDTAVPQYTSGSTVDYRLNPSLTADVLANGAFDDVIVEDCLPKYQQFVSSEREDSGDSITPVLVQQGAPAESEIVCPADQTYIKWDLGSNEINKTIDPIVYTVEILETVRNGTYTNTTLVSSSDISAASTRTDTAQIQIVVPTGIKIAKSTPQNIVEINPADVATPRTLKWTVDFANIDSPTDVSDVDVIDVLPANGIGDTDFEGTLAFTSATVAAGDGITILYTKSAATGLVSDPDDPSNGAAGATVWCDAATGGSIVSGSGTGADCPSAAGEVTGLRFLRAGAFEPDDEMSIDIVMTPSNNDGGDVYENEAGGRVEGVTQPVGPAKREISIIESSVGNFVWEDLDQDGIQDDGEPGVPDFPVKLVGEDLDGNPVSLSTTTDADGKYSFTGLASGSYKVIFDPNGLTSNSTFTQQDAGDDDTLDSDGDTTTGETAEFELLPDSGDRSWDQGLIIDRNVDITIDKRFVSQSDPDDDNQATVTYELVVSNAGTAEGTYDLADELQFGGNVEIDSVVASNTEPGDIETDPDFDGIDFTSLVAGQKIAGGDTHVYTVVVETTVSTTITKTQRDCILSESENGTGYLNEAQLTVDKKTQTDTACGTPEKPKAPPSDGGGDGDSPLPDTGGPALWIALSGMLALAAGFTVLARKREREDSTPRHRDF